jgi:hypothetical protein
MSDGVIALVFAIGVGGWAYSQVERRSGVSNVKTSSSAAAIAIVLSFIFLLSLMKYVIHI